MQILLNHPRLVDCQRLFPRDDEVRVNIGVGALEKRGEQSAVINIHLFVPPGVSTPREDRLHEVVDHESLRRTVAERVAQGHIHLPETLRDDLLARMLAHPRVRAARVTTEKPAVHPDCAAVGCEVFGITEDAA
jgi:7,8-dihydroneopterin aldolase/epimerase/oxygenase